mmetsp:Transcript_68393/g.142597  ORF Transcript_68393/g.142597 Transcript_68393/m.142597 type:complete len:215 (+) Transcript_68393:186-830(+)
MLAARYLSFCISVTSLHTLSVFSLTSTNVSRSSSSVKTLLLLYSLNFLASVGRNAPSNQSDSENLSSLISGCSKSRNSSTSSNSSISAFTLEQIFLTTPLVRSDMPAQANGKAKGFLPFGDLCGLDPPPCLLADELSCAFLLPCTALPFFILPEMFLIPFRGILQVESLAAFRSFAGPEGQFSSSQLHTDEVAIPSLFTEQRGKVIHDLRKFRS